MYLEPPTLPERGKSPDGKPGDQKRLVHEGRAHAALVFDADLVRR
jgi:hypothetical protein